MTGKDSPENISILLGRGSRSAVDRIRKEVRLEALLRPPPGSPCGHCQRALIWISIYLSGTLERPHLPKPLKFRGFATCKQISDVTWDLVHSKALRLRIWVLFSRPITRRLGVIKSSVIRLLSIPWTRRYASESRCSLGIAREVWHIRKDLVLPLARLDFRAHGKHNL